MVDLTALGAALSALKGAKDIAETMISLRDAAAFQGKMIEFQGKILDAQNAAFAANDERTALIDQIRALEKEVADLKAREAKFDRYELKNLGYGSFAYMLKREARGTSPPHWVCTKCFNDGKISIIMRGEYGGRFGLGCPSCKTTIGPNPENRDGDGAKWLDEVK